MAKAPKAAEAASPAAPVDAGPAAPAAEAAAPAPTVDAAPAPAPVVAGGTRDVIILQPVRHDNEDLVIGRSYAIEAKAARALIDCGAAEEDD